jgi:hypothetical protein
VGHLRASGYPVKEENVPDVTPIKRRYGVPERVTACHTALVEGYVVEGHVPADLIDRLLQERPRAAGLAVPGMPAGSPGMDSPGQSSEHYQVLIFDRSGKIAVFATR